MSLVRNKFLLCKIVPLFSLLMIFMMILNEKDVHEEAALQTGHKAQHRQKSAKLPAKALAEDDLTTWDSLEAQVDCSDPTSYKDGSFTDQVDAFLKEDTILKRSSNCDRYFEVMNGLAFDPVTDEERAHPLAFAYTVHKEIGIWELFLSVYFRPGDAHCVHVDEKADLRVLQAVHQIVGCYKAKFPETEFFVPRVAIPVFWGYGGSIMEADLICYRELRARSSQWKYAANVAGTELPFVSHQRFRERLRQVNGNVLAIQKNINPTRQKQYYETLRSGPGPKDLYMKHNKNLDPGPPPCGIKVLKGIKNGAFSAQFLDFVLSNPFALSFYNWIYPTGHPCEHFTSTLATIYAEKQNNGWKIVQRLDKHVLIQKDFNSSQEFLHSVDGSPACFVEYLYRRSDDCKQVKQVCNFNLDKMDGGVVKEEFYWSNEQCYRATLWYKKCSGKTVRGICNFDVEDLAAAKEKACLIGNKFDVNVSPAAILCQIKEIRNLTKNYVPGQTQNNV